MSYFQKCRKTVAQSNVVKLKWKSTLINGDKGQKGFNKNVWKILLGKNETNVFQLCCGKGKNYVGYVGLVGKTLFENYVEMVAGLPRNEQKMKIFCKSNKRTYGVYKHIKKWSKCNVKLPNWLKSNPVVPLQTNPLVFSNVCKEIRFPVCELARRS